MLAYITPKQKYIDRDVKVKFGPETVDKFDYIPNRHKDQFIQNDVRKLKNGEADVIGDIVTHPILERKELQGIKDVKLILEEDAHDGQDGYWNPRSDTIGITEGRSSKKTDRVITHEVQHAINHVYKQWADTVMYPHPASSDHAARGQEQITRTNDILQVLEDMHNRGVERDDIEAYLDRRIEFYKLNNPVSKAKRQQHEMAKKLFLRYLDEGKRMLAQQKRIIV